MGSAGPHRILVINPGGTSTKVALFDGEQETFLANVRHPAEELAGFVRVIDQLEWRAKLVRSSPAGHRRRPALSVWAKARLGARNEISS